MIGHMAMYQPRAGIVFHEFERGIHPGAELYVIRDLSAAIEPTMAVDVPRVEFAANTDDAPPLALTNFALEGRNRVFVSLAIDGVHVFMAAVIRSSVGEFARHRVGNARQRCVFTLIEIGKHHDMFIGFGFIGRMNDERAEQPECRAIAFVTVIVIREGSGVNGVPGNGFRFTRSNDGGVPSIVGIREFDNVGINRGGPGRFVRHVNYYQHPPL